MKKYQIMSALAVAAMAVFVSCENDDAIKYHEEEQVTITASFPESISSKVAFEEAESGLDLKWKSDDELTIVGETTETYTVDKISDDGKTATFKGTTVKGDLFKVILSDRGVNYPTRGFSGQFNPDNLMYDAVLEGVQDYTNVSFTPEWAEANNATFSQTGVLMLHIQLPDECTGVTHIKFVAPTNVFSSTNESDCDRLYYRAIAHSYADPEDGKLKAYWISSMNEDVIKAETEISVILETEVAHFVKDYTLTEDFHITPGKRNVLRLNSDNWTKTNLPWTNRSTWSAPYANVCSADHGPAHLLDGNTSLWCYPWGNNCIVDTTFDNWTYLTTQTWGQGDVRHNMNAPMVSVINLGNKRYLHTVQLKSRTNKNVNTTTGEVWASADTSNDNDFIQGALTKNLKVDLLDSDVYGMWPLWRAKTWVKVGDFDFTKPTRGTNGTDAQYDISALGCPAKYLLIVVHEGAAGASGIVPDIAVSELVIKSYEPVNQ